MHTLNRLRSRLVMVVSLALAMVATTAMAAFATPPTPEEAANTAVSGGVDSATSIVTTNIPLILGVVVAFVALKYGKRILGKL